jgi:hypothetical protein
VPIALTPERFGRMLSAVEQGMSRKGASAMVGIQQTTFNKWQTLAQQGQQPYEELFGLVAFAEARIELYMLSSWVRAAATDWKAAQSYLERRFQQDWGQRPQVTLTLPHLDTLSDEELEQIKGDVIEMDPETGQLLPSRGQHTPLDLTHPNAADDDYEATFDPMSPELTPYTAMPLTLDDEPAH